MLEKAPQTQWSKSHSFSPSLFPVKFFSCPSPWLEAFLLPLYIPDLHFLYAIISQAKKAESGKSSPVCPRLPVPTDTVLDLPPIWLFQQSPNWYSCSCVSTSPPYPQQTCHQTDCAKIDFIMSLPSSISPKKGRQPSHSDGFYSRKNKSPTLYCGVAGPWHCPQPKFPLLLLPFIFQTHYELCPISGCSAFVHSLPWNCCIWVIISSVPSRELGLSSCQ